MIKLQALDERSSIKDVADQFQIRSAELMSAIIDSNDEEKAKLEIEMERLFELGKKNAAALQTLQV